MEFRNDAPKWRQITDELEKRIEEGVYPPGTRVPSLVQITGEFNVAAATAHKALKGLRERGRTYTEPGMGSFVAPRG